MLNVTAIYCMYYMQSLFAAVYGMTMITQLTANKSTEVLYCRVMLISITLMQQ